MHLNHYIAQAGICSRRKAVDLIKAGDITVNNKPMIKPSYQVKESDTVRYKKRIIKAESFAYIMLNKPKGVITTAIDQHGRKTVFDCIKRGPKVRLFAIGRLDKDTTGLLLLTNDGALTQKLAHPKYNVKKVYHVTLDKSLEKLDAQKIMRGLRLRDGIARVDHITHPNAKNKTIVKITLHSGKKLIIRRIFEHLHYFVRKLDRINYAGLTKKALKSGQWRYLTKNEIQNLKRI